MKNIVQCSSKYMKKYTMPIQHIVVWLLVSKMKSNCDDDKVHALTCIFPCCATTWLLHCLCVHPYLGP